MKVGILTFHNAHNYGAVLQAYALKRKVENMGHNVEIINYCNKCIEEKYVDKLKVKFSKEDLKHPKSLLWKLIDKSQLNYRQPAWSRQCKEFDDFISKYLLDNRKKKIKLEDIGKIGYDAIIVGSDQIWESNITGGLDDAYLLNLDFSGRKIAYAASKSGVNISGEEAKTIGESLRDFSYISVRENTLQNAISGIVDKPIVNTLDPTLLLEGKEYADIIKKPKKISSKYIFAYFVVEDKELMQYAQTLASEKGYELIELRYYLQKKYRNHNQLADIGPKEFLGYIKNAETIVTNSFHGTVFSILFHKKFYCVYKENVRIENLLQRLNLKDCHINTSKELGQCEIDYDKVDQELELIREASIDFIEQALD